MYNVKLFVVFHAKIFDECYEHIPQEYLDKYFVFVAVNENIPKEYTPNKYNVINEWDLNIYEPSFQKLGYKENSVIFHIYMNNLHKDLDYIGFFQYDEYFNKNAIEDILNNIKPNTYLCLPLYNYIFMTHNLWNEPIILDYIIRSYITYFNAPFIIDMKEKYPLFNTYIIPTKIYNKIIPWLLSDCQNFYNHFKEHEKYGYHLIAMIYERIMALAIGNEHMEHVTMDLIHDRKYTNQVY